LPVGVDYRANLPTMLWSANGERYAIKRLISRFFRVLEKKNGEADSRVSGGKILNFNNS